MASSATERRIVLLGKTGSGKSSLANTIFGRNVFKVCHSSTSGTMKCESDTRTVEGRTVQLIDTPGLFDTDPNAPDLKKEILKCMIECSSGVHAFLLVLKVERFTKHELSVAEIICQHFSEEVLNYTTVVFTQGDQMEEGLTIKEWIKDNEALRSLVQRSGGRCHVVDNKYWNNDQDPYKNNRRQVRDLLNTIDQTVKENGGRCYTNENLERVQQKLQEERVRIRSVPQNANLSEQEVDQQKLHEERATIRSTKANAKLSEEEVEQKAKENTFNSFWPFMAVVSGVAALFGLVVLGR